MSFWDEVNADFRTEWHGDEVEAEVANVIRTNCREGAEMIAKDAKILCPKDTGELSESIEVVESQFRDGGFLVVAQGPGNYDRYRASFVELGTYKDAAQPFMRPAMHKNKRKIQRKFDQNRL